MKHKPELRGIVISLNIKHNIHYMLYLAHHTHERYITLHTEYYILFHYTNHYFYLLLLIFIIFQKYINDKRLPMLV